ncbi:hypothetical protein HK097_011044, partial [Rhizophlyctis rosea]
MAHLDIETASVLSDTASDFSEASTAPGHPHNASLNTSTNPTPNRTHLYTCLACHVAFHTADQQRDHMRTDWHRYNLKRKVADLPPIPLETFAAKLKQQAVKREDEAREREFVKGCDVCGKEYGSEGAYTTHMASKKHKEAVAKAANGSTKPSTTSKKQPAVVSSPASTPTAPSSSSA